MKLTRYVALDYIFQRKSVTQVFTVQWSSTHISCLSISINIPLSGLLFIIGIEVLGNTIRQSAIIKGIKKSHPEKVRNLLSIPMTPLYL